MTKRTNKRRASVVDMVRRILPDEKEFADDLDTQIIGRRLVGQLATLRNLKELSQGDVAKLCGCQQSRISKLENGPDDDVMVRDLRAYAKAAGCDLTIAFVGRSLVDQVKFHAVQIKNCFDKMNRVVQQDQQIASGVADFHLEALFNLVKIVNDASCELQSSVTSDEPKVIVQMEEGMSGRPELLPCSIGTVATRV